MADTLTPDAVLAMPAGESLDELVATRVLCWELKRHVAGMDRPCWYDQTGRLVAVLCPLLSQSLGSAEYVLDWLRERWGTISIAHNGINWQVMELAGPDRVAYADTLPLALCRAALLEVIAEGK